ncbi:MAG: VOC family protein [Pseudomonadota bacterium]
MSLNYVMIGANNVAGTRAFYDAVLPAIGGRVLAEYLPHAVCYGLRGDGRFWLATPHNEQPATVGNGAMLGLACDSAAEVRAAHALGLAAGGSNEGDPGPRPQYGDGFFGAYLRDPEGNKLSLVYLGDLG